MSEHYNGQPHGHGEAPAGADPASIKRGYELDELPNPRPVLIVPAAIVVTLVLTYLIIWGTFYWVNERGQNRPVTNTLAVRKNTEPLNRRLDEVPAPRLDGAVKLEDNSRPDFETSHQPTPDNSPNYHPEDLRADRQPMLSRSENLKEPGMVRIPIDLAMRIVARMAPGDGDRPPAAKATEGNSGRGGAP